MLNPLLKPMCGNQPLNLVKQDQTILETISTLDIFEDKNSDNIEIGL
jgi:hypothetical protein